VRLGVQGRAFQRCPGHTTMVTIGGEQLWLTAGQRPGGTLGAVAIGWGKHGSSSAGLLESYAMALSVGMQHGVPLTDLLRPGLGLRFSPDGRTDDPEIPKAYSPIDYCCRRLAIDWLPYPDRAGLGVFTAAEQGRQAARIGHADSPLSIAGGFRSRRTPRLARAGSRSSWFLEGHPDGVTRSGARVSLGESGGGC
jgi:hypothetical protein